MRHQFCVRASKTCTTYSGSRRCILTCSPNESTCTNICGSCHVTPNACFCSLDFGELLMCFRRMGVQISAVVLKMLMAVSVFMLVISACQTFLTCLLAEICKKCCTYRRCWPEQWSTSQRHMHGDCRKCNQEYVLPSDWQCQ
jgi:hypothetical protein